MDKIIVMEKDKILNIDIFEYIENKYKYQNNFVVCHITEKEYKTMVNQIKNDGCLKEKYSRIDNLNLGYDKYRYMLTYNPKTNVMHLADYNNPDKIGAYTIDENGISYNEEMEQFPNTSSFNTMISKATKIYTTISYEDVINHYTNIKRKNEIPNFSLEEIIDKVIENPREFYTKISDELSIEEREYLKSIIQNKTCGNCSNMSCRIETYEKLSSNACIAWENRELIGKQKILYKR